MPFASEAVFLDTNYGCTNPDINRPNNPCWPPRMTANPAVVYTIQGLLSIAAIATLAQIALWFKKPRAAAFEPVSIASVAAISGHPDVARDFLVSQETTTKELKKRLEDKKYKLSEYQTASGTTRFGLVPVTSEDQRASRILTIPIDGVSGAAQSQAKSKLRKLLQLGNDWKQIATYVDGFFLAYLVALLGLTATYMRDVDKAWLAKIFGSSTLGRRIFFAAVALIASTHFSKLEKGKTLILYA